MTTPRPPATPLPVPHPAVLYKALGGDAVLLHTEDEVYFGLNAVGMRIWELLPPRCDSVEQLCAEIQSTYPEVPAETVRSDVVELLGELERARLVHRPEPPRAP